MARTIALTSLLFTIGAIAQAEKSVTLKDTFKDHFLVGTVIDRDMAAGTGGFRRSAEQNAKDIALIKEQFNREQRRWRPARIRRGHHEQRGHHAGRSRERCRPEARRRLRRDFPRLPEAPRLRENGHLLGRQRRSLLALPRSPALVRRRR